MSSAKYQKQYLTSADMSMIMRVHTKVCTSNSITARSIGAERIAALLVREFQYGVNKEPDLLAAFTADDAFRLSVPVSRIDQFIGNALSRWEVDHASPRH
ncbi:hypothetical protein SAZ10_33410 [Mesorhizobium sp. BAC0120]|uniref:hypothetical protein n=1 Tax=Mesorhizobium sp. BAC0120 TaxID=3090670 RepID=UPI00298CCBBC|nr:hypothetical protein [Mesorhizobium sp. BAC0120]MDW6026668.1 hypothetical protein [Mesorhizobium sp. BAC0120]